MLTVSRHLVELDAQTAALAAAAREAGLDTPVPSCPEWTVADLAAHVGGVHRWCAGTVSAPGRKLRPRGPTDPPMPGSIDAVESWLGNGSDQVASAIRSSDENTLVGGFRGPVPVRFWARRMCHETLVHRIDAELAADWPVLVGVESATVADAVDEHLTIVAADAEQRPGLCGSGETLGLLASDEGLPDPGWWISFRFDGPHVERAERPAGTAIRGSAAALLCVLTSRLTPETAGIELRGSAGPLQQWRRFGAV